MMNKNTLVILMLAPIVLSACATHGDVNSKAIELTTDKQKADYASGFEQLQALISNNPTLDRQAYRLGIIDALENKDTRLTKTEMDSILDRQAFAKTNLQVLKHAQLQAGQAFLKNNLSQTGIKALPSGLQYKVISQGKGKATPNLSDRVLINFHLARIDNSNLTDGGAGKIERESQISKLPKGLQEALQLMTEGDYWQLFIPPGLHYGEHGSLANGIMPNETLLCDIELKSINSVKPVKSTFTKRAVKKRKS